MPARVWNALVVREPGDRGLAEIAAAQRAVVGRQQLLDLGIGAGSIRHRVSKGVLHIVLPSAFAVGSPVLTPLGAETAALVYAGDNTVLSHESAAAIWGLITRPSSVAITR